MSIGMNKYIIKILKDIPYVISILALILILISFFINIELINIIPIVILFISCILWILVLKNTNATFNDAFNSRILKLSIIIYFLLLSVAIVILYSRQNDYERPMLFFVLCAIMSAIVSCEILCFKSKYIGLILFQTIIIGLLLPWSASSLFPNVIGIDDWWHQMFTDLLIGQSSIPSGYQYSNIPLFHVLLSDSIIICGINFKFASIMIITLSQIVIDTIVIYLITKIYFDNKIALFSSLFVILGTFHIALSEFLMPFSVAVSLSLVIIYLISNKKYYGFQSIVLISLLMFVVVLFHTIAALCLAIILVSYWLSLFLSEKFIGAKKTLISISIPVFFVVLLFSWWSYASDVIYQLADLISWGFNVDFGISDQAILSYSSTVPFVEQLVNNLGVFIIFSSAIIGVFYTLHKRMIQETCLLCLGFVPLLIGYLSIIMNLWIIVQRWWYFAQVLLSIPFGLTLILALSKIKRQSWKYIVNIAVVMSLAFILIISSKATIDNNILTPNTGYRTAYSESEIASASYIVGHSQSNYSSDYLFATNPSSSIFINYYLIGADRIKQLDDELLNKKFYHNDTIIIIRDEIIDQPFKYKQYTYKLDYNPNMMLSNSDFNKIYSSNSVNMYG